MSLERTKGVYEKKEGRKGWQKRERTGGRIEEKGRRKIGNGRSREGKNSVRS